MDGGSHFTQQMYRYLVSRYQLTPITPLLLIAQDCFGSSNNFGNIAGEIHFPIGKTERFYRQAPVATARQSLINKTFKCTLGLAIKCFRHRDLPNI